MPEAKKNGRGLGKVNKSGGICEYRCDDMMYELYILFHYLKCLLFYAITSMETSSPRWKHSQTEINKIFTNLCSFPT